MPKRHRFGDSGGYSGGYTPPDSSSCFLLLTAGLFALLCTYFVFPVGGFAVE